MRTRRLLVVAFVLVAGSCAPHVEGDDEDPGSGDPVPPTSERPVVGTGESCGGFTSGVCSSDDFCDFPDGYACGEADGPGVCTPRPKHCRPIDAPVIGCDGNPYANACEAHAAGFDDR